jgi:hypothetical protein
LEQIHLGYREQVVGIFAFGSLELVIEHIRLDCRAGMEHIHMLLQTRRLGL